VTDGAGKDEVRIEFYSLRSLLIKKICLEDLKIHSDAVHQCEGCKSCIKAGKVELSIQKYSFGCHPLLDIVPEDSKVCFEVLCKEQGGKYPNVSIICNS
jgi:hypothetical protein